MKFIQVVTIMYGNCGESESVIKSKKLWLLVLYWTINHSKDISFIGQEIQYFVVAPSCSAILYEESTIIIWQNSRGTKYDYLTK